MSIYKCAVCDEYKDADKDGINEITENNLEFMCDQCEQQLDEQEGK